MRVKSYCLDAGVKHNKGHLNVLLIGPLPPPVGGATRAFSDIVSYLDQNDGIKLQVHNTVIQKHSVKGWFKWLISGLNVIRGTHKCNVVSLHCTTTSVVSRGLVLLLLCRVLGKPLILRKFGGTNPADLGPLRAWIALYVLRNVDLYLAETQYLVTSAELRGLENVRWFPNTRSMPKKRLDHRAIPELNKRFRYVYIGHVRGGKGMVTLARTAEALDESITVDIYGPWYNDLDRELFEGLNRFKYKGSLEIEEVHRVLSEYDAFVFPSHWDGEGHPGSVIEALGSGLPVVTTQWRSIPEVVTEDVGILVEPKNAVALARAMNRLASDPELYLKLKNGTRTRAELFSSEERNREFLNYVLSLASRA